MPTNPLACEGGAALSDAGSYNGGRPPGEATKETLRTVDVPKLVGIGYFDATSAGVAEAAPQLEGVEANTDSPAKTNITTRSCLSTTPSPRASTAFSTRPTTRWRWLRCCARLWTQSVVNGSEVLLGDPMVFKAENLDDCDF